MTASHPGAPHDELTPPASSTADSQTWSRVLRVAIIVAFTAGCTAAVVTGWSSPARAVFAFGFLLFCPGLALAEVLEIRDLAQRLVVATGASLALDTLLSLALIYAGAFSVRLTVVILAVLTLAALGVSLARESSHSSHSRRYQPPAPDR